MLTSVLALTDVRMIKMGCFLLLLFSLTSQAQEKPPLQVLVGMNKPPYVQIETSDGFELELLREIVLRMGYRAEFTHVPNKRIQTLLQQGIGDIATLQPMNNAQSELFYSCPYIRYQNVVVSLEAESLSIMQFNDLRDLSLLAFQNASQLLGDDYRQAVENSYKYRETVEQSSQVESLHKKRVQALVMDVNIFYYHHDKISPPQQVKIHPLFPASYYRAAFRKAEDAKAFDAALKAVLQDDKYHLLQERYRINAQSLVEGACEGSR
ncbi:transporter substrate-binding domain-containing protein [Rheinheimera riviphila]|uniref:Transporter substrate-binding domain-containing protein n=2 Tax=Rheinheimera riviphila TaxID=1834037 RepID=A0A437R0L7_9GAMM|nr:transporter substrate-binding domain-containing protein [Rheinheimera riviphila]